MTDVIISHLHYDHCGNHGLFPRARYHLQDREMAYATGRCMCHAHQRIPFEVDDVMAMVRKVFDGRVVFHDGVDTLAPGLTVHHIGGHSMGLQCVRVKTRRGHVVLAADATHLYSHINEGRVFPITYSVAETLEGYATIKKLADSPDHIIPGHDRRCSTATLLHARDWRSGSWISQQCPRRRAHDVARGLQPPRHDHRAR